MRPVPPEFHVNTMPKLQAAAKAVYEVATRPNRRLADMSVAQLVKACVGDAPAWLTGSSAWLPATCDLPPDPNGDFDVVFVDRKTCESFAAKVLDALNARLPPNVQFSSTTNLLGGTRIMHPDGRGVIDAWYLGDNESIGELLMNYPAGNPHIRCAYRLNAGSDVHNLIRLVRIVEAVAPAPVTFGVSGRGGSVTVIPGTSIAEAKKASSSSYYGYEPASLLKGLGK